MANIGKDVHEAGRDNLRRTWYSFTQSKLSLVGLVLVLVIALCAIFAPFIAPYPEHAGPSVDFANASRPPSIRHWFGTDPVGRDVFSRVLFACRSALIMGLVVLGLSVPFGTLLGLLAGYRQGSWVDIVIMRVTDVFLAVPPLILALAVASVLKPTMQNALLAITVLWWTWYTRLVYGLATSFRNEYFVKSAELTGASTWHILTREILPNCLSPILTKATLDMGWVIMMGASLSFVGLGEQPPTPALGNMVSEGIKYMPDQWWLVTFPGLSIMVIVLAFNLLGDGIRDVFSSGVR